MELIEESAKYASIWVALSSVGGVVSLYLGISLVSAFEVLELLARLLHSVLTKRAKDSKN